MLNLLFGFWAVVGILVAIAILLDLAEALINHFKKAKKDNKCNCCDGCGCCEDCECFNNYELEVDKNCVGCPFYDIRCNSCNDAKNVQPCFYNDYNTSDQFENSDCVVTPVVEETCGCNCDCANCPCEACTDGYAHEDDLEFITEINIENETYTGRGIITIFDATAYVDELSSIAMANHLTIVLAQPDLAEVYTEDEIVDITIAHEDVVDFLCNAEDFIAKYSDAKYFLDLQYLNELLDVIFEMSRQSEKHIYEIVEALAIFLVEQGYDEVCRIYGIEREITE